MDTEIKTQTYKWNPRSPTISPKFPPYTGFFNL